MDVARKTLLVSVALNLIQWSCALCPLYQVPHLVSRKDVCCQPIFHCPEGHEIVFCTEDGGEDVCKPCEAGSVNWHNTSSLDTVRRTCFNLTKDHNDSCPVADTHPIADNEYCKHMKCKCQFEFCHYGDPCLACKIQVTECPINQEMNKNTGVCEPCKDMMYSPFGCAPCLYNETAWRISERTKRNVTNNKDVDSTDTSTKKSTDSLGNHSVTSSYTTDAVEEGKDNSDNIMVPVIVAIVVLVAIGVLIALFLYAKKKASTGDETSLPAVVYTKMCSRRPRYQADAGSLNPPTTREAVPRTEVPKPAATISPMVQGAHGHDEGDEARMDLLKNGNNAACGDEEANTDVKQ